MPEMTPEEWADAALRRELRGMDVPEPSPDFDQRVLSAVRGRSPLREVFLSYLRPALATASVSTVVTLLLVHWSTRPVHTVEAADVPPPATQPQRAPDTDLVERLLNSPRPTYLIFMKPDAGS